MHVHRTALRSLATTTAAAALTLGGLAITASPASALAAPGRLKSTVANSSTAILSWSKIPKATTYDVQVDSTSSFSSPDFSASTANNKVVPSKALVPGKTFWRVRAAASGVQSKWVTGSFTVAPVTTPIPLSPANGESLPQPGSPPLLQWSSSQGAVSYNVTVDGDADMIGAKVYTTKTTSLVVPDPLTIGDWYWQVTAVKGPGLVSLPSTVSRFDIQALAAPTITYPANNVNQAIEDVVLDWDPVPGARYYDVQVAVDDGFNNITYSATNVRGSRLSPATTPENDQFWWRVRAVDLAGQPTPWATSLFGFQRQWLDQPQPVYPIGNVTTDRPYIQWTPVQHATRYELYTAANPQMTVGLMSCDVVGTTYVPRAGDDDCGLDPNADRYWEVRAMDDPYPSGLPGIFSVPQPFRWTPVAPPGGTLDLNAVATGLKVAVDGGGSADAGKGCVDPSADPAAAYICDGVPGTPVFSWDPVPGATSYHVDVAQDVNFTTSEMNQGIDTKFPMMALQIGDQRPTLPESQAGSAYYWHVTACAANGCTISPVSRFPPVPGSEAFRKSSPSIGGLATGAVNSSEITFSWQDYLDANQATVWRGESANQSAKSYRIQVATDPSFGTIVDTALVDQATYTAIDKLYADGTYFWRVQATDRNNFGLTWSAVQSFTKSSPGVSPSSPVGGAAVPGTMPFRWPAAPFAASYEVELYRNHDLTFSTANRVFSATVKTAAYAPSSPVPAAGTPYVWRVRRLDASNNPGPWSSPQTFYSTGVAPNLLTPKSASWVPTTSSLFQWTEVPGAASYSLNIASAKGGTGSKVTTVATAVAPSVLADGKYTWDVTAYDGAGQPLATSAVRKFSVDAKAPVVTKITPTVLKPTSTIKAFFSEKMRGISKKTIVLTKEKATKKGTKLVKVPAKIKAFKKKKAVKIDPKGRLRPGRYVVVFNLAKLKDVHGNNLVPNEVVTTLRTPGVAQGGGAHVRFTFRVVRGPGSTP